MSQPLPAHPLHQALRRYAQHHRLDLDDLAAALRLPPRSLDRLLARSRVSWQLADEVAVRLGRHPSELWPDWFDTP